MKIKSIKGILPIAAIGLTMTVGDLLAQGTRGPGGPGGGRGGMMRMVPVMAVLDADADGQISAKEIENASMALKKLDKNKDGKLTEDELRPEFGGRGGRGERGGRRGGGSEEFVNRMMNFDENGDGKLSKDELPERMQAFMARADSNNDGDITKQELEKMAASRGSGRGRGGQGENQRRPQRPE